jgi:hypothetical protein
VLFRRLSRNDQRHALDVYRSLQSRGYDDPNLLVAALLHDVGKAGGHLSLPYRIAVTLLQAFSPGLLAKLETSAHSGLLAPFRVARQHAELGAQWAAAAGFSTVVTTLIRYHHTDLAAPGKDRDIAWQGAHEWAAWIAALQRADEMN